jgi:hypothetical protein
MKRNQNRSRLAVERLEAREMPATLVNPTTVTYQDVDGDDVKVVFSKAILTANNVNSIFTFDMGNVNGSNATKQQLQSINLSAIAAAAGTAITVTATHSAANGGDGFAAVGQIDATGLDLGAVNIDGDLGRILAGDAVTTTSGLKGLTVLSMGRYGTLTGAPNLDTAIQGKLDSLTIKTDLDGALVEVLGGVGGKIGNVQIGGSILATTMNNSGVLFATGDIGAVTVGGNLIGSDGVSSGQIASNGKVAGVTIGGNLQGGAGMDSGLVRATSDIGPIKIGGNILGGGDDHAGAVDSTNGKFGNVNVGGSMIGGAGMHSASLTSNGDMGVVKIAGDLVGNGASSGEINANGKVAGLTIGGSVRGGPGAQSASVSIGGVPNLVIGGDVVGDGDNSGVIRVDGKVVAIKVGGSIRGGAGFSSGRVEALAGLNQLTVSGDVVGGADSSGCLFVSGILANALIGGSVRGGSGSNSGDVTANVGLKNLVIKGDFVGGSASGNTDLQDSGFIWSFHVGNVTIGGSMISGVNNSSGVYFNDGIIQGGYDIGSVTVKGNVLGNSTNPALITAVVNTKATATTDLVIGSITVGGNVEFGEFLGGISTDAMTGKITGYNADAQIGAVTVGGNWVASILAAGVDSGPTGLYGAVSNKKLSGQVTDVATTISKIASITIGGQALGTTAALDYFGIVAESIGPVKIGGTPLTLIAGADNDVIDLGITGDFKLREV